MGLHRGQKVRVWDDTDIQILMRCETMDEALERMPHRTRQAIEMYCRNRDLPKPPMKEMRDYVNRLRVWKSRRGALDTGTSAGAIGSYSEGTAGGASRRSTPGMPRVSWGEET